MTSTGIRLLADLHELFCRADTDRMTTADLIAALCGLEDAPWADLHGKPLDSRRLSKELARYGIKPKNLRLPTGAVTKGYRIDGEDGYLPAAATAATPATAQLSPISETSAVADLSAKAATESASHVAAVAAVAGAGEAPNRTVTRAVADVAAVADGTAGGGGSLND
jgi:hypothetical protein